MFNIKNRVNNLNKPKHMAFIMDGNGRWAKKRLLPRKAGHKAGVVTVQNVIDYAFELKIKYITFYAFSTENWKRPENEINTLFNIFREFLKTSKNKYKDKDIKLIVLGDLKKFPEDIQISANELIKDTNNCKSMVVSIAFNYGSRDEILRAVKLINENNEEITDDNFKKYLYTKDLPDPDIIIRTSGEKRLSNFLLYQAAYSELYFINKNWPDFNYKDMVKAIKEYAKRNRRFGGV